MAHIMKEGGVKSDSLMSLIHKLFHFVHRWNMTLHPCYITGSLNAVSIGMGSSSDITRALVQSMGSTRGRLVSRYFTIHCHNHRVAALNALHQHWSVHQMYAFPPPQLIPQTLAKLAESSRLLILTAGGVAPPSPPTARESQPTVTASDSMATTCSRIKEAGVGKELARFVASSIQESSHRTYHSAWNIMV